MIPSSRGGHAGHQDGV
jgi:hypothetical protein